MKKNQIWQVRYQLNGCYLPDNFALFSDKKTAIECAREDAQEFYEHIRETIGDRIYFFVREEWQELSREHDTYPYMIVVEPVSWRDIARDMGVKTRTEVLDQYADFMI